MNGNFELFMCCLGNGITVCNKAVKEHGEYKHIAHISDNGKIKLYVSESYVPIEDMRRMEQTASKQREEFLNHWNRQTLEQRYYKLLDMLPVQEFLAVCKDESHTLEEKVTELEKRYI